MVAQAGPLSGGSGLGLSGGSSGTAYAAGVVGNAYATTTAFSEAVWFKTTSTTGGTLMGLTNTPATNSPSAWDRMMWVDDTGKIVFGVYPGKTVEVTSTGTYNNGAWHLAVGTLGAGGMTLSVDGTKVRMNPMTTTAQAYTGYWHVGWDNEARGGWTDPPTTPYFAGTLADAAIFPTALTAAQITTLYQGGTGAQSTWNADLTTDGATRAWSLGDDGSTAYTGAVPDVTPNPCAFVDVTVGAAGAATTCAAPSGASACGPPTGSLTLANLGASTAPAGGPTPAQPLTVTLTVARDTTHTVASSPYATGLHLTVPMAIVATDNAFTATLNWPAENLIL